MLNDINIENILFLDIETVPQNTEFSELDDISKKLWEKKSRHIAQEDETPEATYKRAGIYAEFGKIVCISVGYIYYKDKELNFKLKSYYSDNEKEILQEFATMLDQFANKNNNRLLCAHNGKEFDFPYIARRILINGLKLPALLDIAGKKPWEIKHLDTMELWKFGDFKNYTSLELLSYVFDIPTPKDDIDGSMVAEVYYKEKNIKRIAKYCEKDVLTIAQLILRYKGMNLIHENKVAYSI